MNIRNKLLKLAFLLSIILFTPSILALLFAYDNYSHVPLLKYSFSFTGKNWFKPDEINSLEPKGFKTIEFGNTLPALWEITPAAGKALTCWRMDDLDKKPIKSILVLKAPETIKQDNLLLDVTDSGNQNFTAVITDLDGEKQYSDFVECNVY